jgi:hypothetical protein
MRTQADLVDQLFNSREKRLARILLLLAEFGKPGEPESLIPEITQETLAEMIGTTRSRVSFFMNRFREHGFIEYNGRIRVHKSLLNVILTTESNAEKPPAPYARLATIRKNLGQVRHRSGARDNADAFPTELACVGSDKVHVFSERAGGSATRTGAASSFPSLRTDSVNRGLSISLFTLEMILFSLSI